MAWDKLTVKKGGGGIGFRDIHGFNLALLRKQGWKFMSNPDSMVSRLVKAKYFSRVNFLGLTFGHNPSYCWCSIWSSRVMLNEGYRWRIGDASNIDLWGQSWIREGVFYLYKT